MGWKWTRTHKEKPTISSKIFDKYHKFPQRQFVIWLTPLTATCYTIGWLEKIFYKTCREYTKKDVFSFAKRFSLHFWLQTKYMLTFSVFNSPHSTTSLLPDQILLCWLQQWTTLSICPHGCQFVCPFVCLRFVCSFSVQQSVRPSIYSIYSVWLFCTWLTFTYRVSRKTRPTCFC